MTGAATAYNVDQMSKIHDGSVKLTATFLNGVSIGMMVAGVIAPLAAFTYSLPSAAGDRIITYAVIGWAAGAILVHVAARLHLRRLTP